MKTARTVLILMALFSGWAATAQVQWYQNQHSNNPMPSVTVGTSVQSFNATSFIGCYLWSTEGDQNTWKISRSDLDGNELKTFYVTGISALVEFKVSNNSVYVFERSFTPEFMPKYKVYRLNANLVPISDRNIALPNDFIIYNTSAFEVDGSANVYFAGDGQYIDNTGNYMPASFVWKMDKFLNTKWKRVDSSATSYSRLHIERSGKVVIISDYYETFPAIKIRKFTSGGQPYSTKTVSTSPMRYSLYSALDKDDNVLLYGGKTIGDTAQAVYFMKISRSSGNTLFQRTHFTASSSQLNDLRIDGNGRIFTLVTQTSATGSQFAKISRIKPQSGNIYWNRTIPFGQDSCNLSRMVINGDEKFYVVGERKSCNYFSKGFAIRIKKYNGTLDGDFPAPDSVNFQRSHWLADGLIDKDDELIAIGNTTDLDTMTFSSTYFRAFAVRFNCNSGRAGKESLRSEEARAEPEAEEESISPKLAIYPNPVQDYLTVTGINGEYDIATLFNVQGAQVKQQYITSDTFRMDMNGFVNGVYLLVLRSSATLKEKTLKVVLRK